MPHSSGGGSHGGGSHGGSGFSSSGGSSSGIRTSRTYYPGCRTYVYYRHHRPYYIYANGDLQGSRIGNIIGALFLLIFIIVIGITLYSNIGRTPKKLTGTDSYEIIVKDDAHVLESSTDLTNALNEFKNKTGIVPAIMTVNNETWKGNFADLEIYAYDLYVNNFIDEKHWLIVYSVPSGENKSDWCWEAMQGDDTDNIITESKANEYTKLIHKYLSADSMYTDTQALTKAFEDINLVVMDKPGFNTEIIPLIAIEVVFIIIFFCLIFQDKIRGYKASDLKEVKEEIDKTTGKPKERNCDYCGGLYVVGVHTSCPHCGARVLADDYQPEQKNDDDFTIDSSKY